MKNLFLTSAICLLAAGVGFAQSTQPSQPTELLQSNELNSTVVKLYNEGKYDEALPLEKRALELREKVLGSNNENLIALLVNLAELYRAKKKPGEAKSYLERALQIGEKAFGPKDVKISRLLDKLAFITYEQGNEKSAENFFARSLAIKENFLGPDHSEVAQTAFNLGEIYRFRGDYPKAGSFYQQVVRIREKSGGKDNSELLKALHSYVTVLLAQDKPDEGAQVQKRILELLGEKGIVEGGIMNGRAVRLVQPPYPPLARQDHASGQVRVRCLIDETGKVIQAKAIDSVSVHMSLVSAAEDAARHSVFTPTLLSGVPVKVNGIIIYNFIAQ